MMKKIILSSALFALMLSAQAAVADESEAVDVQNERTPSFWDRWFGRTDKTEKAQQVLKEKKVDKEHYVEKKREKHKLFSDHERDRIREYYRSENQYHSDSSKGKNKKKSLPPGLQKKLDRGGQLPPGWQAKVSRGQVLDSQILSQAEYLPSDLGRHIELEHDGTVVRRVGDKVVRVLEGNGTVIDVIDLADIFLR